LGRPRDEGALSMLNVDLLDPRLYDDPWHVYRRLRDEAPLYYDVKNALYAVSRHADVERGARDAELYCSGNGNRPIVHAPLSILRLEDPEDGRQRRFVSRGFTPNRVRAMSDRIRAIAREVVDEIGQRGDIDFVGQFAVHVPLIVIAELLGF